MSDLLQVYKNQKPEVIFEWKDAETGATGWVVINSLRNGAAGGGTRMRKGLTLDEVVSLAKVMEIKFAVCGPEIGGAKSGIDFDPSDPRRQEVLQRWFKAVFPLLKHYYGTGGDLNVDELKDVAPITEELGLWHPQEGIVNGHFRPTEGQKINIIGQLRHGCAKVVEDARYLPEGGNEKYAVADLVTGFGVAESVRHFYDLFKGQKLNGKRAIVQGWGNVASAAAVYLSKNGASIVGIIDRDGGILNPAGFNLEDVKRLFLTKKSNRLAAQGMISFEEADQEIWKMGAEIFIPGAASKLVTRGQMESLMTGGLETVACGANVPFVDDDVFFGPTARWADEQITVIPDFVANCGMARVFAYLMQPDVRVTDAAIFEDVSATICSVLQRIRSEIPDGKKLSATALHHCLNKLALN